VLFIDKIEKCFCGNAGSANTDGDISVLVFGSLPNWLAGQDRSRGRRIHANDVIAAPA